MFGLPVVESLNALYLAPMAVISVIGTATLFKLVAVLLHGESHPRTRSLIEPEDA